MRLFLIPTKWSVITRHHQTMSGKTEIKSESLIFHKLKFLLIRSRLSNQNLVFLTAENQKLELSALKIHVNHNGTAINSTPLSC